MLAIKINGSHSDQEDEDSGFSLIEVVIVMAVMAIIAAIAYPNYRLIQNKAKRSAQEANLATVETALETYYLGNGQYPTAQSSDEMIRQLLAAQVVSKGLLNPYTGKGYESGEAQGRLVYVRVGANGYSLTGYGLDSQDVVGTVGSQ